MIFGHFTESHPCPFCAVPMIVEHDLERNLWTLVHGEVPVVSWKDEMVRDLWPGWGDSDFQRDVGLALDAAHWH